MKRILIVALAMSALALAQQNRGSRAGGMGPRGGSMGPQSSPRTEAGQTARPTAGMKGSPRTSMVDITPRLSTRLQPLLPEGVTAEAAAQGFKNTGQFIAALHVSKNLGIPFADLKAQMTGTKAKSLGQAIETLKPDLSQEKRSEAAREATREARQDEKEARTNAVPNAPAK